MKTILIAGVMLMLAAPTNAQTPPQGAPPQQLEPGEMKPGEIQKLFDAYIVVEAQRALELRDSQYPQFIAKLRVLQDARRRNQQEKNQLMQRLQRLTAPRAPAAESGMIEGVLKSLQELPDLEASWAVSSRRAAVSRSWARRR